MKWEHVTSESRREILERCAELYKLSHENADVVPQKEFGWKTLKQLLTYNPNPDACDAFNRYRERDHIEQLLKVRAGSSAEGGPVEVALFVNKTIRRRPPRRRTLNGSSPQNFWNLSIACMTATTPIYDAIVGQCRVLVREVVKDETFLLLKGRLNSPVDELVDWLDKDGYVGGPEIPPYTMLEKDKEFLPWWDWGTEIAGSKNREVGFRTLQNF